MSTDTLVFSNDNRFKKPLENFCQKGAVAKDVSSVVRERCMRENLVTETLQERGGKDSSLVSFNIDQSLRDHWATRLSQRTLSFMINLVRKLTVAESLT